MSKYFPEDPAVTDARSKDPAWVAEQARKREAASAAFADRREAVGLPLIPKKHGERF